MRASLWFVLIAMLVAGLLVAGCPKQPADEGGTPPAPPTKTTSDKPAPESAEPAKAEFTEETVVNFLKSMEDEKVSAAMDATAEELGMESEAQMQDLPAEKIKEFFDKATESKEVDEAVKEFGFKDAKDWVSVAAIVFPCLPKAAPTVAAEMAKMMGMEEGTPEYQQMMEGASTETEFEFPEGVFPEPTEEQVSTVSKAMVSAMKAEFGEGMAAAGAGAPGDPAAPAEPGAAPTDKPEGEGAAPAEPPTDKPAGE